RFGSWYLAAAGYNTGENRVGRIMRQVTGSERGEETDYYRIWSRLPRETRDYVPPMVAAARISKEPERYGFGDVRYEDPLVDDRVTGEAARPLAVMADGAGTTVDAIRDLNRHFKLNRTRNDMAVPRRVPVGGGAASAASWPHVREEARLASAEAAKRAET